MSELKQTKGYAQLRGIIGGLDRVKDAITTRKETKQYTDNDKIKKLQFSVKTSEDNMIYVELKQFKTGNSLKNVYISKRDEDTNKTETKAVPFNERHRNFDDGWRIIGVSLKSNNDEYAKNLVPYDAIDYVLENFSDGDSVFINAEMSHTDNGEGKFYTSYEIKRMYVTHDPIVFESEEFEEQSDFTEDIVFAEVVDTGDNAFVKGFAINYRGEPQDCQFLIDKSDKEVIEFFKTDVKFGDVVSLEGIINNRVVYKYREASEEEKDDKPMVGRKTKSSQNNSKIREIESENRSLQIIGVTDVKRGMYTAEELGTDDLQDDLPF